MSNSIFENRDTNEWYKREKEEGWIIELQDSRFGQVKRKKNNSININKKKENVGIILNFFFSTFTLFLTVNKNFFTDIPTVRLSQRNGDVGEGRLEVYHAEMGKFMPACIPYWDSNSAKTICSMLGYT